MSPVNNEIVLADTTTLKLNCSGGTNGIPVWKVNGSYLSTTMLGISHGVGLDIVTGFSYRWIEIAPVPSNNNTNITCEVIDVNGALVESNSTMLLIQGTVFSCNQFYVFCLNRS